MESDQLLVRTADIVAAHAVSNAMKANQLPAFIGQVYKALAKLGMPPVEEAQPPKPAVLIRLSVKPDHITCLVCGARFKMLKRHLLAEHTLTASEYRHLYGLPNTYPMVAPNYAKRRSDMALSYDLGRKAQPVELEPDQPRKKAPRAKKAATYETSLSAGSPARERSPATETLALPEPPTKRAGRPRKT